MRTIKHLFAATVISLFLASCGNAEQGHSTPIDSTNVNGDAPATYGADNPKIDPDSNRTNVNDTGTNAGNVHNNGDPGSGK